VGSLLKQGLIWWTNDGYSAKIWAGKWLRTLTTFSVQSPRKILEANAKVRELIDMDT
jgi:hypothetical protein